MLDSTTNKKVLHRAPWVVTGQVAQETGATNGVIQDGAVMAENGRILAIGRYKQLAAEYSTVEKIEHDASILAPPLINGHTHLELSHLPISDPLDTVRSPMHGMTDWITNLLARKQQFFETYHDFDSRIMACGLQTLDEMFAGGVAFAGDIGNHIESRQISREHNVRVCFLLELIGFTNESADKNIDRLHNLAAGESFDIGFTAHAPYSATRSLMQEIKKYALMNGNVFSIHVAESSEEIEFLQTGSGKLRSFLEDRGAWDNSFKPPGTGAIRYLDQLGILDHKTLCVHAVHIDDQEIMLLAEKKAKVCLCPGSNRTMAVGKAPVGGLLAAGILPAIGTDSLASNISLNMWREMQILREDHPELSPEKIFDMATGGGAAAWGCDDEFGSLAPGKRARFLSVIGQDEYKSGLEVLEYLTGTGELVQVNWVE